MSKTINFDLKNETKTCYRFEHHIGDSFDTLYLKKEHLDTAGIDPKKGIAITIIQKEEK